jgi:hypothetical protein
MKKIINDEAILKTIFLDTENAGIVAKGLKNLQESGYVLKPKEENVIPLT